MLETGPNRTELLQARFRNSRWSDHEPQFIISQSSQSDEIEELIDPEIIKQLQEITEESDTCPLIENWTK